MFACGEIINVLMQRCYAANMAAKARERGDETEARFWDRVRKDVDAAPPLSPGQRDRLRVLLHRRDPAKSSRTRPKPPDVA